MIYEMKLLSAKEKKENKEESRQKESPRKTKRGMTSAGAAFVGVGIIGLFVFGYELFQSGGISSLTAMADGIGLIASIILLIAGVYMK